MSKLNVQMKSETRKGIKQLTSMEDQVVQVITDWAKDKTIPSKIGQ